MAEIQTEFIKHIPKWRYILPTIFHWITGNVRTMPDKFEWVPNLWTYNFFRVYEWIFWRRYGNKAEISSSSDGKNTIYRAHSWEAAFVLAEQSIRNLFSFMIPIKIWIPMLSLPGGLPVPASPYLFAIALDTSTTGNANSTSLTIAHTITGSGTILWSSVAVQTSRISTNKYNTVDLTKIGTSNIQDDIEECLWYLAAPAGGAHNLVITPNTSGFMLANNVSYSGAAQTGIPDASGNANTASGSSHSQTLTSSADNCWAVWSVIAQSTGALTDGANTVRRKYDSAIFGLYLADTNAVIHPAGSIQMNVSGGTMKWYSTMATFAPGGTTFTKSLDETITVVPTITKTLTRSFNEVVTVVASVTSVHTWAKSFNEVVTIVDTLTRTTTKVLNETITVVDSIFRTLTRSFNETITIAITSAVTKVAVLSFNEVVTIVDTLTRVASKVFNETITIVDTITRTIARAFNEVVTIVPAITTLRTAFISLDESLQVTDTISRVVSKVFNETITIVATITRVVARSFSEVITITDTITKAFAKSFDEALTITDTFVRSVAKVLNETIAVVPTLSTIRIFGRSFSEVITITDTITKAFAKSFDEALTITDTFVRSVAKVLNETIAVVPTLSTIRIFGRSFTEAVTIVPTITRVVSKVFNESVRVTVKFQIFLNGVIAWWLNKFSKRNTSWGEKYSKRNSNWDNKL